jgi:hypothetical protein
MEITIPTALKVFSAGGRAVAILTALARKSRGESRALLFELRDNLTLLDLVAEDGVDLGEVVDKLAFVEHERLAKSGFNFNLLKRKKIARLSSLDGTDLAAWQGKRTSELIDSIYVKVRDLKMRYPHVWNNPKYRWSVRVNNIRKRTWLLLRHLDS